MRDADHAVTEELLRKEKLLLDPAIRRGRSEVAALLADGFFEFGSSGRIWTRDGILDLLATENYDPPTMEAFACRLIEDSVALVTYRTVRLSPDTGQSRVVLRSSIWIRQSGHWRVQFHQGTPASQADAA
jgi:hypothetical protein